MNASYGVSNTISVVWPYAYKWLWYACRSPLSVSLPHSCSHFFFPLLTLSLSPSLTHSLPSSFTRSLPLFPSFFLPLSPSPLFFLTLIKMEDSYNSCLLSFKLHTVIFHKDSMPFAFTKDSHVHSIVNYSRHCLPS